MGPVSIWSMEFIDYAIIYDTDNSLYVEGLFCSQGGF